MSNPNCPKLRKKPFGQSSLSVKVPKISIPPIAKHKYPLALLSVCCILKCLKPLFSFQTL